MQKNLLIAVAAGAVSAVLGAALFKGGLLAVTFFYLAALPVMLAGFALGVRAGAVSALAAALLTGAGLGEPLAALLFALAYAFPAWIAVRLGLMTRTARGWTPPGAVCSVLTLLAAGILLAGLLMLAGGENTLAERIAAIVRLFLSVNARGMPGETAHLYAEAAALWLPGGAAASWLVMICVNAAFALFILSRNGKSLRPCPKFSDFMLPDFMSWPLIAAAAAALILDGDAGFISLNLTLVFATPFFLQGLAAAHTLARRLPAPGLALGVMYIAMIFQGWVMAAAAGLGMLEQWAGVRGRFARPGDKDGKEKT